MDDAAFEQAVSARLVRVADLRAGLTLPALGDGPGGLLEVLVDVRSRLDQVEEFLTQLTRLRGAARRAARQAKDVADDAWNASVTGGQRRRGDFGEAAPRERYAQADLAVLDRRREERRMAYRVSFAEEAVELTQLAYRGLSDTRRDLHVLLRAIEIENSLER
jgi:hypothetical protein